jgi:hypothetical protein
VQFEQTVLERGGEGGIHMESVVIANENGKTMAVGLI